MELIFITGPIFILIGFGYLLRVLGVITKESISTLNRFVYFVSLPAVILMSFWGINWLDPETRSVLIMNTAALCVFAVAVFILLQLIPIDRRLKAGIFIASVVGNTVYMGFPIGERALGEASYDIFLAAATPHLVIGIALSVLAVEWFVLQSHNPLRYLKDFLLNPLILALVGGILLSVLEVSGTVVDLVQQPLTMLAATASPIALITLGAFMYGVFAFRLAGIALFAAVLKLLLLPLLVFGIGRLVPVSEMTVVASVLAAAMPTAVTSFVIAEKYNAAPKLVATALFVSTIFSVGTITLVLLLSLV